MYNPVTPAPAAARTCEPEFSDTASKRYAAHRIARHKIDQFHTRLIAHNCLGAALKFRCFDDSYKSHDFR